MNAQKFFDAIRELNLSDDQENRVISLVNSAYGAGLDDATAEAKRTINALFGLKEPSAVNEETEGDING